MMKRVFDNADRTKKMKRFPVKSAPDERAQAAAPPELAEAIRASLADGFLPCATAFAIAKKLKASLVAVGSAADDLGVRVVDCQLGCFKVDKTSPPIGAKAVRLEVSEAVESCIAKGPLTCAGVLGLARRLKVPPLEIADAVNQRHAKIHHCQLGCF